MVDFEFSRNLGERIADLPDSNERRKRLDRVKIEHPAEYGFVRTYYDNKMSARGKAARRETNRKIAKASF